VRKRLPAETIDAISSAYLREGRRQEAWALQWVEIEGDRLYASVAMTSVYAPSREDFHLTIFATLEFTSQLMIVYAHDWAGLDRKLREGWMVESRTRTVRAVRRADEILVEMHARRMRKRGVHLYCEADYVVTDAADGRFEVTLKGFLS
jgi:hypothetical protein